MKKIKIIILVFIVILVFIAGFFFFWNQIVDLYTKLYLKLPQLEKGVGDFVMQEIEKRVSLPPPLRSKEDAPESLLTRAGIIRWTNTERAKYGLPALKENAKLDSSADLKVKDMFEKQYFEHLSPSGKSVGDLAEEAGYEFISIGENLALGNFEDDEALIIAWMESPGHRENILNNKYRDIGIGIASGSFEGKVVWIAVQHFGLSLAICPRPDTEIKSGIETDRNELEDLEARLEQLLSEIQNTKKRDPQYNQKVEEYNVLVAEYNALVGEIKTLIDSYNNLIKAYNVCLEANQ